MFNRNKMQMKNKTNAGASCVLFSFNIDFSFIIATATVTVQATVARVSMSRTFLGFNIVRSLFIRFCFKFWVAPLHSPILKPNFYLDWKKGAFIKENCFVSKNKGLLNHTHTCASVSPKRAANFLRSGFVMYFCIWNWISKPLRCNWLKTARDHDRLRFVCWFIEVHVLLTDDALGGGMLVIFGFVGSTR